MRRRRGGAPEGEGSAGRREQPGALLLVVPINAIVIKTHVSTRACLRCGPESMPLVGVGSWYTDIGNGVSSWLFAWPISEQVKLGVPMEQISEYLSKFSLPDTAQAAALHHPQGEASAGTREQPGDVPGEARGARGPRRCKGVGRGLGGERVPRGGRQ